MGNIKRSQETIQYGSSGPVIKANGSALEARTDGKHTALVPFRAGAAVGANDLVTKGVHDSELDTIRPGVPMMNRLRLLGAPGAAVEGNTVVVGADTYEFRDSTPPAGGTAGRIWVYGGADSAASRANLIKAINGTVDAALVTRDGANTEEVVASAGITTGDVIVQSADAIGGNPAPSATAIACSETLATATDIWDQTNTYNGLATTLREAIAVAVTLTAAMIAKGTVEVLFDFTPRSVMVVNRSRPQDEAYTISGNAVSLTLAGGASPNNQADDVIDVIAFK